MAGQAEKQPSETPGLTSLIEMFSEEAETEVEASDAETAEEQLEETEPGDDGEAEESDSDSESDEETEILVHEGKEVNLKKAELKELAQKGFDYTKKTMALAEERKALEPIREKAQQTLTHYETAVQETLHRLNTYAEFIEADLGAPPSIELAQYDAAQYIAQKDAYEQRVNKLSSTYRHIQQLDQEKNQLRQSQLLEQANETERYLVEHLPGWKEAPEKSLNELNTYLMEHGLSPESTKEAYVAKGLWEIAHKAREYDKLKTAQSQLKPKATLPRVSKPSVNPASVNVRKEIAYKAYKDRPSLDTLSKLLPDF